MIPVTTSDGSKLFVSGPCIVLKTQTPAPTVAQQMQALRPLLKADTNANITATHMKNKKTNDQNNNSSSSNSTACFTINKKNSTGSNVENEPEPMRCKRRIDFSSLGLPRPQPAAMARRNERERNRVKQVNLGFETLRQHVPQGRKNKKLSKVDTLKEAVKYIKYLHQLLQEADEEIDPSLTAAISDTITMVSRSSFVTNASVTAVPGAVSKPETVATTHTPSPVTVSTNTAAISAADLMQLTTPTTMDASTTMDFACEPATGSDLVADSASVFRLDAEAGTDRRVDFGSVADMAEVAGFGNVPQMAGSDSMDMDSHSPSHLLELAPAQPNFLLHKPPAVRDSDHQQVILNTTTTTTTVLPILAPPPPSSAAPHPSPLTFMDFTGIPTASASPTPSPDCPAGDLNPPQGFAGLQSLRMEQGCRGSEGSCPVSPSESGSRASEGPEDCLGVSEGETWQDLSADIAEWLCSKIDIDDPDVFV